MNQKELRIGIVGAGSIVRERHVPGLNKIPGVRLVGVVNRTPESSERAAHELGIEQVYSNWEDLVQSDKVDAVLIGTWPYMHCPVSIAALEAGKHVFCQARMCMNYKEACRMLAASEKSGCVAMLCPPPVGLAGDYWMKELLSTGFVGEPRSIQLRAMTPAFLDPKTPLHWRQERSVSGYNTLTVGICAEVIHRWFGYAARVTSTTRVFTKRRPVPGNDQSREVEVPDAVFAAVEMESGAFAGMQWSAVAAFPEPGILEIHGSKGTLRYLLDTDEILGGRLGEKTLRPLPIPSDKVRRWTVEEDFVAAIREGKPVSPSFYDGLKYMEFTEAVVRSGEEKRSIALPFKCSD